MKYRIQALLLSRRAWLLGVLALGATAVLPSASAAEKVVSSIRAWYSPERLRLVMDVSSAPTYQVFRIDNPPRLVVDFHDHQIKAKTPVAAPGNAFVSGFRLGQPKPGVSRLVLDIRQPVDVRHSYVEPKGFKPRVVMDIYPAKGAGVASAAAPISDATKQAASGNTAAKSANKTASQLPKKPAPVTPARRSEKIVVIDAGHGGKDPGALGRRTREKIVVLEIARRLKKKIDAAPGLRAVMTRNTDTFIKLGRRREIAREHKADLFISIHADAFKRKSARGSSVYALSLKGASSEEAKWLAQKENAADLVGGVALSKYDEDVREVLLDLSMGDTIHQSIVFADSVLAELKRIGKVHSRKVERAGFLVLKSPDIPSILVETAFITNPQEEKLLRTRAYQDKLATAVLDGIKTYLKKSGR